MPGILKLKHWQLFLVVYGLPWLFSFAFLALVIGRVLSFVMANDLNENKTPDVEVLRELSDLFSSSLLLLIIPILLSALMVYWRQKVVDYVANVKMPGMYNYPKTLFRLALWVPVIVSALSVLWVPYFMDEMVEFAIEAEQNGPMGANEVPPFFPWLMGSLILFAPISVILAIGQIWTFLEVGRAIKSAEVGRKVSAGEVVGELFLVWFFFIGVWFLQPRVNRLDSPNSDGNVLDQ